MTSTCSGCGLHRCSGECYDQCPSDYPDEPEAVVRQPYVPSPEWIAQCALWDELKKNRDADPECGDPFKGRFAA